MAKHLTKYPTDALVVQEKKLPSRTSDTYKDPAAEPILAGQVSTAAS